MGTFHDSDFGQTLESINGEVYRGNGGDCNDREENDESNYEESFDARYHWFECPSISHIWNQGNCAADWVR